jgi:hypothetical protein
MVCAGRLLRNWRSDQGPDRLGNLFEALLAPPVYKTT